MKWPTKEEVEQVRRAYPPGTIVRLVRMDDPQAPPPGTTGKVIGVDDTASLLVEMARRAVRSTCCMESIR